MATYQVVDLYANLEEGAAPIRIEFAQMRLDVDPGQMSLEEREQAAGALREALARVELGLTGHGLAAGRQAGEHWPAHERQSLPVSQGNPAFALDRSDTRPAMI